MEAQLAIDAWKDNRAVTLAMQWIQRTTVTAQTSERLYLLRSKLTYSPTEKMRE